MHKEARARSPTEDYDILLIGHEGHEEVDGTTGEAPEHIQLVEGPDDVANIVVRDPDEGRLALADDALGRRDPGDGRRDPGALPELLDPPSDDICYATQNRQTAVKEIAPGADLVIVVGSSNSSNSVRLVEVALEAGASGGLPRRRRQRDRRGVARRRDHGRRHLRRVGAGVLVDGVLDWLAERGYPDAEVVHSAEESLIFALPPELRRDLRAASRP